MASLAGVIFYKSVFSSIDIENLLISNLGRATPVSLDKTRGVASPFPTIKETLPHNPSHGDQAANHIPSLQRTRPRLPRAHTNDPPPYPSNSPPDHSRHFLQDRATRSARKATPSSRARNAILVSENLLSMLWVYECHQNWVLWVHEAER